MSMGTERGQRRVGTQRERERERERERDIDKNSK